MPKNKPSDIDELLAKSQRLPSAVSSGGFLNAGISTISRGVSELREASIDLCRTRVDEQSTLEALRQLSQRNFDAKKLQDDVSNRVFQSTQEVGEMRLEGVDIEGYLAHHHDMIVLKSINDAMKEADRNAQAMHRRWAANEWNNFRSQYMSSLGHRIDNWGAAGAAVVPAIQDIAHKGASHHYTPGKPANSGIMNITASSPYSFDMPTFRGTPSSTIGKTRITFDTPIQDGAGFSATKRPVAKPALSELLSKQTKVVRNLVASTHTGHLATASGFSATQSMGLVKPCAELAESVAVPLHVSAKAVVIDGLSKHDMSAYKTILSFLSTIVSEGNEEVALPGFFSAICFEEDATVNRAIHKRELLSAGAMRYLEWQMWQQWSTSVDEAVMCGDLKIPPSEYSKSKQQRLRAYVNYLQESLCSDSSYRTSLWAYVYHCIRIGDISVAVIEIQKSLNTNFRQAESSALVVLNALCKLQSENLSFNDKQELHYAVNSCYQHFLSEMKLSEDQRDVYKAFVLSLLSIGKVKTGDSCAIAVPDFQVEDFMWAELWFIQTSRSTGLQMKMSLSSGNKLAPFDDDADVSPPIGELALYDLILEFGGADYFDKERSTPFKYATILLSCQRYGDAIMYLWTSNKVVAAVHLTVVCLYYGLILPHVPLTQNPLCISSTGYANPSGVDLYPDTILKRFVDNQTFLHYPEIKIDYVLCLDTNWLAHVKDVFVNKEAMLELKEVNRIKSQDRVNSSIEHVIMSIPRDQLVVLVGDLVTDSTFSTSSTGYAVKYRTGGRLDEYLDDSQVNGVLRRTAYSLLQSKGDLEAERAVHLYQLAGCHMDAIDMLCKQLAPHIIPSQRNSLTAFGVGASGTKTAGPTQREFWLQSSEAFITSFLSSKEAVSASIVRNLTKTPTAGHTISGIALAETLQTLTALTHAVDHFMAGDMSTVLEILDAVPLKFLPQTEDQVSTAVAVTSHAHYSIKVVLDDTILIAMRSIRSLYEKTRTQQQQSNTAGLKGAINNLYTDKDAKLQQLKTRASAIKLYTAKIKDKLNLQDTLSSVTQIESSLIK